MSGVRCLLLSAELGTLVSASESRVLAHKTSDEGELLFAVDMAGVLGVSAPDAQLQQLTLCRESALIVGLTRASQLFTLDLRGQLLRSVQLTVTTPVAPPRGQQQQLLVATRDGEYVLVARNDEVSVLRSFDLTPLYLLSPRVDL